MKDMKDMKKQLDLLERYWQELWNEADQAATFSSC